MNGKFFKSAGKKRSSELEQEFNKTSNSIVRKNLSPIGLSLGILYTLLILLYYFSLTDRTRRIACVLAGITAVIMYLTAFYTRKRTINLAAVHPLALFGAVLVLMNAVTHLMLTGQAWQSYIILLLLAGSGFIFFSTNALVILIILSWYCWLAIAWNKFSSPVWVYHGLALLVFGFVSILIHITRKKNLENVVNLQWFTENRPLTAEEIPNSFENQENIFCDLLEDTDHLLLSIDQNGKFQYVNRRWKKVMGYDDEELGKINIKQTIEVEYLSKWNDIIQHLEQDRSTQKIETVFVTKDGQRIRVEGNLTGQFQKQNPVVISGIFRDITSRKKTEEALMQERLLLRTVIDNIPEAIYAKDINMRKILINKTDLANIGKTETEVLGKTDLEVYPSEVAEKFMEDDRAVLVDGKPVINREELLINDAGQKMWLLTSKLPMYDNQKKIIGLIGIGTNITELKNTKEQLLKMQTQLQELNKKLSLAYEEVRNQKDNLVNILAQEELIFLFNSRGVIQGVTEQAIRVTGLTRLELVGKNFADQLDAGSSTEFTNLLHDVMVGAFKTLKIKLKRFDENPTEYLMGLSRLNMEKDRLLIAILRKI